MAKKLTDMTANEYMVFHDICGKVFKEVPIVEDTSVLREFINEEERKAKEQLESLQKRNEFLKTMIRQIEDGTYKTGGK